VTDDPQSRMLPVGWQPLQTASSEGGYLDEGDRAGFYSRLQKYQFDPSVREVLPRAWDRPADSASVGSRRFFLYNKLQAPPCEAFRSWAFYC
jgi:hypothetical protein